jgi:DNA-directed RNA polymerase specialized sigma24 family protein
MTKSASQLGTRDCASLDRKGEPLQVEKLDYPEQANKYLLLLESTDREIVTRRIHGDSYNEISELTGIAPCKVKNLYSRAIQKIRNKVLV